MDRMKVGKRMLWLEGMMGLRAGRRKRRKSDTGNAQAAEDSTPQETAPMNNNEEVPDVCQKTLHRLEETDMTLDTAEPAPETTAAITDFVPQDDSLLFIWDDSENDEEPTNVSVLADPENIGQLQVWMGDQVMAQISGREPLSTLDIAMIPLSSAQELALVRG